MKRKFNIWLFGLLFVWLDDLQADLKQPKIYEFVKIIIAFIVGILPYCFTYFTWFRILVYFVEDYYYLPIDLDKLINKCDLNQDAWHIHDMYESHQLDQ